MGVQWWGRKAAGCSYRTKRIDASQSLGEITSATLALIVQMHDSESATVLQVTVENCVRRGKASKPLVWYSV